jgi:hypothetical protein
MVETAARAPPGIEPFLAALRASLGGKLHPTTYGRYRAEEFGLLAACALVLIQTVHQKQKRIAYAIRFTVVEMSMAKSNINTLFKNFL